VSESRASTDAIVPENTPDPADIDRHAHGQGVDSCRIVAIGASAGGLDAFTRLLEGLPARVGMALVLTQHLDPTHTSHLSEILSRRSKMPVTEVVDGAHVEIDHVYVIPAKAALTVSGGFLHLGSLDATGPAGLPIDRFFASIARECGEGSVGVILSGTGTDGTLGLAAIKQVGGLTFAEDPETAEYHGMPRSALDAGVVDAALSPEELAQVFVRIGANDYVRQSEHAEGTDEAAVVGIVDLMRASTGLDLSGYRRSTLCRRISRRMLLAGVGRMSDYLGLLGRDAAEVKALYRDVLVNVTEFFRDSEVLEAITDRAFPEISRSLSPDGLLRVWVPGCSRGQEAYSIAILISEFFDGPVVGKAHVFATDVNAADIEVARAGVYPESIEAEVSPERLERFFSRVPGGYRVDQALRDMCVFAVHDVVQDPPFSNIDLVSFRNVLIYMERSLQESVFQVLHYALKPGGFLILGTAEAAATDSTLFTLVDKGSRIYRRAAGSSALPVIGSRRTGHGARPTIAADDEALETATTSELEDLRTINEEFQTAQEELQSTNEELTTLNDELRARNAALVALTDDLTNVLEGAEIPMLILDSELRIRRFTPQSDAVVSILPADVGRPITDFRLKVVVPDLVGSVQDVLRQGQPSQTEVQDDSGRWYSMRIRPFRTGAGEFDGAVVAFFDVDSLKKLAQAAQLSADAAQAARKHSDAVVQTVRDALLSLGDDLCVREANGAFYRMFDTTAEETIGRPLRELGNGQWNIPELLSGLTRILREGGELSGVEVSRDFEKIGLKAMILDAGIVQEESRVVAVLLAIHDVTELKTEQRLSDALLKISLAVSSTLELTDVLPQVIRESTRALEARSGATLLYRDAQWWVGGTYGLAREHAEGQLLEPASAAISLAAVETREPLLVSDVSTDDRFAAAIETRWKARSVIVAPMLIGDIVVGSIGFHYREAHGLPEAELGFIKRLAALLALALENARRHAIERQIAATLQKALLTTPRRIPGVDFGYLYRSATEAAAVGGDFYDLIELDADRAGFLIGDVSGKGIEAATLTALVKNTVRALAYDSDSPSRVIATTSDILFKATPASMFVTMFFCILDLASGRLTYSRAGHPYPMLRHRGGEIESLEVGSAVAGAGTGLEYVDGHAVMGDGDVLVLFTDGVTEARRDHVLLGEERLAKFLRDVGAIPTRDVPQFLFDHVLEFTGGSLSDDVAIVAISRSERPGAE
jgi:chemotaxis methyl-accepting protein methylase/serine phosphatase RsbU (regulator of sigma subunit)